MDHITDQLELLSARLPARGGSAAAGAASWQDPDDDDSNALEEFVLRGKLELQNVRLASEYAQILPAHQRRSFFDEFAHFFGNPATAPQAFRLALSLLPAAMEAGETQPPARASQYVVDSDDTSQRLEQDSPLFSLLKDEIYRDVALFITANEDRPQFLQDFFGLLQGCNNDYLRQRALNALNDIMSSVLVDEPSPVRQTPKGHTGGRPNTAGSSIPGSIRTHQSVTEAVGYDYDEVADGLSVPTPVDGSSIHSSATADDPVFGKDPLAETMVFQGGASAPGNGGGGGFDQLLARLDESLRRSALDDRSHYPEDLLPSESEDGTRTDSTMDTSVDEAALDVEETPLANNVARYIASLPADAVIDGASVDALVRVIMSSLTRPLPAVLVAAVSESLARYLGQPVQKVGVSGVTALLDAEMARAAQAPTVGDASDAESDNRRDDALAAAGELPDSEGGDVSATPTATPVRATTPPTVARVASSGDPAAAAVVTAAVPDSVAAGASATPVNTPAATGAAGEVDGAGAETPSGVTSGTATPPEPQ